MIRQGILNPEISSLLCRFRHTNTLVISDRGFPYWPAVETVDISLIDDVPTVRQVISAVASVCVIGKVFMAEEFLTANNGEVRAAYEKLFAVPMEFEPHVEFKKRVPHAIGLIRTGDTTQYGNIILESA